MAHPGDHGGHDRSLRSRRQSGDASTGSRPCGVRQSCDGRASARVRLLIVEDHDELVTLLRRLLGEAGYASDHVATVEDALLMLELGSYAAVVLDIGLPDPDGREVARRLRARGDGWLRRALRGLRWRSAFAAAAITRGVERERA